MDRSIRSITKALVWNLIGFVMMCLVGFVMTGSVSVGGTIALVNTMVGLVAYIIYERVWARIRWGLNV